MQTVIDKNRESVFHEIYQNSFEQLFHFTIKLVKQSPVAQDIVQQSYLKLWQTNFEERDIEEARKLLFTYVRNLAIDIRRKEYAKQRFLLHIDTEYTKDGTKELQTKEAIQAIEAAIEEMPPKRKEIYKLSRHEGLSHEQIALHLSISRNTVNNQIASATEFLKAKLVHLRH
jgi:RNA polymerase sigma factor (sigma-70 family)